MPRLSTQHVWALDTRAVHNVPRTQYRSNRKEYRIDRIESLTRILPKKREILKTPLLGELSRTSRDSFESESDSNKYQNDRPNYPESGMFFKIPLLIELSRSSRDLFESDSDSNESRDDLLNLAKSGILKLSRFFDSIDSSDSIIFSIRSILPPCGRGGPP